MKLRREETCKLTLYFFLFGTGNISGVSYPVPDLELVW